MLPTDRQAEEIAVLSDLIPFNRTRVRQMRAGVHGRIVQDLGEAIVRGRIRPGDRLPDYDDLSIHFAASRTAIREALKVLTAKGLIDAKQRAGTRVRPRGDWDLLDPDVLSWHTPETISQNLSHDLVELRELVEPISAGLAAMRATEIDIDRIQAAFEMMAGAGEDKEKFYAGDLAFHLAVLAGCHNQLLTRFDGIIGTVLDLSFQMQADAFTVTQDGIDAHYEILHYIKLRHRRGAERAMRQVIGRARDELARRPGYRYG
jgi:DNA-binding FadR family transcriptional regulator